jgi:hypothetical protein
MKHFDYKLHIEESGRSIAEKKGEELMHKGKKSAFRFLKHPTRCSKDIKIKAGYLEQSG